MWKAFFTLKVESSGAVKVKYNNGTYMASGSATLVPYEFLGTDGSFKAMVYVYIPPKPGKFDGYVECAYVQWNAATGSFHLNSVP